MFSGSVGIDDDVSWGAGGKGGWGVGCPIQRMKRYQSTSTGWCMTRRSDSAHETLACLRHRSYITYTWPSRRYQRLSCRPYQLPNVRQSRRVPASDVTSFQAGPKESPQCLGSLSHFKTKESSLQGITFPIKFSSWRGDCRMGSSVF